MCDNEEIDLELLRSAALATIGKKQSNLVQNESDDLDALRKMALTSRKNCRKNKSNEFEQDQPAKSRSLIDLTSDHNSEGSDENEEDSNHDSLSKELKKSNSIENVSSDSFSRSSASSASSEASSSEEEEESNTSSSEIEERNEEDDLLSAIDQFLDEGVMMLEEADHSPKKPSSVGKKTKKVKSKTKAVTKKKKKSEKKSKSKEEKVLNKEAADRKTQSSTQTQRKVSIEKRQNKLTTDKQDVTRQNSIPYEEESWKSGDLPLKTRVKHRARSDSVHSSDLSFLSNADRLSEKADERNSDESDDVEVQESKQEGRYIRINKRKLDQLHRDQARRNRVFMMDPSFDRTDENTGNYPPADRDRGPVQDRNLPDLREKLKRRGLHSKRSEKSRKAEDNPNPYNDSSLLVKKIYVKPGVVQNSNGLSGTNTFSLDVEKQKDRLVVSRKITNDTIVPLKIRIDDRIDDEDYQKFRRKRSVVPYNPEESATDKKKRLESIKKKAEETRKAKTMSDLSEDFDDFEIEEESEEKVPENHENNNPIKNRKTSSSVQVKPEIRRFISSSRVKPRESDSSLSDYNENLDADQQQPLRSHLNHGTESATSDESDVDDGKKRIRSKVNLSMPKTRERGHRVAKSQVYPERTLSRRSETTVYRGRNRSDQNRRRMDLNRRSSSPQHREQPVFRRKRRINVASVEETALKKSVKQRLGLNREESRFSSESEPRRRKIDDDEEFSRFKADREKDVDERILRIKQKNAEIKKRRKMIEMEEQQFRLKAS